MTYFSEINWSDHPGGVIKNVEVAGLASDIGLRPGDQLLAINGNKVDDIIDVQYHASDEILELFIRRGDDYFIIEAERDYNQFLGIEFEHPTFDTDIRRCNNLCEFCFVLQMAPRFRRTLYIKDDDYRYSFLFGHFVTLTNLSEHDWWKIKWMALSPLYVSVHVTDLDKRRQFLRNPSAPDILAQIRSLAQSGIKLHTQLVIVPDFNDGPWLERSIRELAEFYPAVESISVVPVGLTKHHKYKMRSHTSSEAQDMLDYLAVLQNEFLNTFSKRFVYATDEWYLVAGRDVPLKNEYDGIDLSENGLGMVRSFLDEWKTLRSEITSWRKSAIPENGRLTDLPGSITLVTGTLFATVLNDIAAEFSQITGIASEVVPIMNGRFGESITVAGLLMGADVKEQLAKESNLGDMIVLPRVMFDHPQTISLDDATPHQLAAVLNRTVVLADSMGDVWDAAIDASGLIFEPE